MNKHDFIEELRRKATKKVNKNELEEIVDYYSNYIDDVLEIEGVDEYDVIQGLGDIDKIIDDLIIGLNEKGIDAQKKEGKLNFSKKLAERINEKILANISVNFNNTINQVEMEIEESLAKVGKDLENTLSILEKEANYDQVIKDVFEQTKKVINNNLDINDQDQKIKIVNIDARNFNIDISFDDTFSFEIIGKSEKFNFDYEIKEGIINFKEIIKNDKTTINFKLPTIKLVLLENSYDTKFDLKTHNGFINIDADKQVIYQLIANSHNGKINIDGIVVDNAKITNHNSSINIDSCLFNEPSFISNHNSKINIDDSNFKLLSIVNHNSNINIEDVNGEKIIIKNHNALINLEDVCAEKIEIANHNGPIDCENITTKEIYLNNVNNKINCHLIGTKRDVCLTAKNKNKEIYLNEQVFRNKVDKLNPDGKIKVTANNINGNIIITTENDL